VKQETDRKILPEHDSEEVLTRFYDSEKNVSKQTRIRMIQTDKIPKDVRHRTLSVVHKNQECVQINNYCRILHGLR